MVKKEFKYKGKSEEEIKNMTLKEFAEILPSRIRRTLNRGFTEAQKKLLKKVEKQEKNIKTHCRGMVILPKMIGMTIKVHNGKEFTAVIIDKEKVGHRLGEFVLTRKGVKHSSPGIGATRSSASASVK